MRRKVYTVKGKRHKGDDGTIYRLFRGSKMLLDLWVEKTGEILVNRDHLGIARSMLDSAKNSTAAVRQSVNPQHLIGAVILREEYGTADSYFHYREFSDRFIWKMLMLGQLPTRFGSEEVFAEYLAAKQEKRDKKPGQF